ncbi:MAG: hypothetical protein WKG00_04280 [Polyangiaceae bacterium]
MRLLPYLASAAAVAIAAACGSGDSVGDDGPRNELPGTGAAGGDGPASSSPASSSSASSGAGAEGGGPSGTGGAGGSVGGEGGAGGGTGGDTCLDEGPGEPNETEATAFDLGDIEDCDSAGDQVSAVLDGPDDVDWYRYDGDDTFGCSVDPNRGITVNGSVRLCKFVDCVSGTAEFDCPEGSVTATSPGGHPGCCSNNGFGIDPNCSGIDDDSTVYIRIDEPTLPCAEYTVTYQY